MNKLNKRQLILIGILVIMLIILFADSDFFSVGKSIAKEIKSTIKDDIIGLTDQSDDVYFAYLAPISELNWLGSWENDPFFYVSVDTIGGSSKEGIISDIFGSSQGKDVKGFELSGISWHGNSGYALINESIVKEGDAIGGYKVDKIASNYVILKQGAQAIRLSLNE